MTELGLGICYTMTEFGLGIYYGVAFTVLFIVIAMGIWMWRKTRGF